MLFHGKGKRRGKSASSFLNFHRESIGISLISLWLETVLCSLVLVKICCNKPRFCDCICHKWLSVGWVFAILVLWRLCFCFDSTGFTAMTSLSRKRIIIMPSTNDNKLGECSICIVPAVSYIKSRDVQKCWNPFQHFAKSDSSKNLWAQERNIDLKSKNSLFCEILLKDCLLKTLRWCDPWCSFKV